ncbi:hypothetical protein BN2476_2270002 [Paraburkholderia piptadeniae]|uniref:Uncharacterized protein n=1 Tax=Paraburkholderia piptadeniae TaxID=1701573 RepID=A0A1N7SXX5_9BURK|nr:hypothetical protein BN2476_2270002 [Paraburkholderia piptadeniae]
MPCRFARRRIGVRFFWGPLLVALEKAACSSPTTKAWRTSCVTCLALGRGPLSQCWSLPARRCRGYERNDGGARAGTAGGARGTAPPGAREWKSGSRSGRGRGGSALDAYIVHLGKRFTHSVRAPMIEDMQACGMETAAYSCPFHLHYMRAANAIPIRGGRGS